jgi:SAM-dependent methyltransferase
MDAVALPGVDVVHDVEKRPLPFEDGKFEEILCRDILEHVDYIPLMGELHRILKAGGILRIRVPHFTSENNFVDPTHKHRFSIRTFEFFVKGSEIGKDYYFDTHFREIRHSHITFEKGILLYNHLVEPVVNSSRRLKYVFECTFLSRLFPAENVIVELVK